MRYILCNIGFHRMEWTCSYLQESMKGISGGWVQSFKYTVHIFMRYSWYVVNICKRKVHNHSGIAHKLSDSRDRFYVARESPLIRPFPELSGIHISGNGFILTISRSQRIHCWRNRQASSFTLFRENSNRSYYTTYMHNNTIVMIHIQSVSIYTE